MNIFSLLLLTFNAPLQKGKCTPAIQGTMSARHLAVVFRQYHKEF